MLLIKAEVEVLGLELVKRDFTVFAFFGGKFRVLLFLPISDIAILDFLDVQHGLAFRDLFRLVFPTYQINKVITCYFAFSLTHYAYS